MGAFILHDLHQPFNSLFVNLYLSPRDFALFKNIGFYLNQPLRFVQTEKSCPVGKLADLEVHFMHYHSEQEAMKMATSHIKNEFRQSFCYDDRSRRRDRKRHSTSFLINSRCYRFCLVVRLTLATRN